MLVLSLFHKRDGAIKFHGRQHLSILVCMKPTMLDVSLASNDNTLYFEDNDFAFHVALL